MTRYQREPTLLDEVPVPITNTNCTDWLLVLVPNILWLSSGIVSRFGGSLGTYLNVLTRPSDVNNPIHRL